MRPCLPGPATPRPPPEEEDRATLPAPHVDALVAHARGQQLAQPQVPRFRVDAGEAGVLVRALQPGEAHLKQKKGGTVLYVGGEVRAAATQSFLQQT